MALAEPITLYSFVDQDRSSRVRWTARELGIELEEARVEPGRHHEPAYLSINPWGRIPAIVQDGKPLCESGAICTWLAEQRPDAGLIVPPGTEHRADYLQWLFFACATFEDGIYRVYFEKEPAERDLKRLRSLLRTVDVYLATHEYLVAGRFTLVDILAAYIMQLCRRKELLDGYANIETYLGRLAERPAAIEADVFGA